MSLSYPQRAFDHARPVLRARRLPPAGDKFTSITITIAIHMVIAAMALTAVHVTRPKVMQELSVQITPARIKQAEDIRPLPKLAAPRVITAPPPEISVQIAPPPVVTQRAVTQ